MIDVAMMQVGTVPQEFYELFGAQFFSYVLPWLFTFAIVYGILSHIGGEEREGIPESNSARVVIGAVLAFIITPALSPYVTSLMRFSAGFVMLVAGLLVFIVLLEVLGLKTKKPVVGEEGEVVGQQELSIFEEYPKLFAFIIGVLAVLVFFGSGAADAVGFQIPAGIEQNYPLLFFLGVMVLVIGWMISE